MHQYRVRIIYKPRPDLFIVDWLSRQNHREDKDAKILAMKLGFIAILATTNIPGCMTMHELQQVTSQDQKCLKEYIIQGWPEHKDQIQDIRPYWTWQSLMGLS